MKKFLFVLAFLIASIVVLMGQDTTLVKKAEPLTLDESINNGFAPFEKAVSSVIFYSIPIKKTVESYVIEPQSDGKVHVTYDADSRLTLVPDYKSEVSNMDLRATAVAVDRYLLEYGYKDEDRNEYVIKSSHRFGESVDIGGYKFKVENTANISAGSQKLKANSLSVPIVLIVLLLGALYFTIYFKFVNFTKFKLAINIVRGKYSKSPKLAAEGIHTADGDNPDTIRVEGAEGEVSHFQALTAALSATVGLGNIAGVAIAIVLGGPGATFWMILAGLLGMSSKFAECTLGVRYRDVDADGTVHGGPMYYLSKGLKEMGMGGLGKVFAVFFAIMCVGGSFGGGNMFQANQAAAQFLGMMNVDSGIAGTVFGLVMAVLVGVVIIGGIKRIGSVTEKVVPFMAAIYVFAALAIILMNITEVGNAFGLIFSGAFTPTAVAGGFVGVLIQGFKRAAFSNEAGVGSAAIAHSAVKTDYAASEGVVALLEPFIDTVVICTMTALVIIITGNYINPEGLNGVDLTSAAFAGSIPGSQYILTLAVVLFAFSTMLSWSYYGLQAWKYLFGKGKVADMTYKILFLIFIVIGAAASLGSVVNFSDAMIFAMVFPNIIGVILLAPKVREELNKYLKHIATFKN